MMTYQDFFALEDARGLFTRLQQNDAFRRYLKKRLRLVVPAAALFALISIACAAATAVSFAELSNWLALPGFLLAPVVLVASLFVQGLVFLSWLERRALQRALGHHRIREGVGEVPPVPWALAALVLFIPLVLLAVLAPLVAVALVAAAALVPLLYVRLENTAGRARA